MTRVAIRSATHSAGAAAPTKALTVGFIGDSITLGTVGAGGSAVNGYGMPGQFSYTSVQAWALLASGGKFTYGGTWATGGLNPLTIRTTWLASAIAAKPDAVVVLAGTNKGASLAADISDLTSMYTQLRAAGIIPILCTLPPFGAPGTAVTDGSPTTLRNAWIRRYARLNSLPLVDYYSVLTDPATGAYATGYSTDGTHPTGPACKLMGDALAAVIEGITGPAMTNPDIPVSDSGNTDLMLTKPLMTSLTDWTKTTGDTATTPAGPTGVPGNVLTITRSTADTQYKSTTKTLIAGHTYQFAFKFRATVTSGSWTFRLEGGSAGYLWAFNLMNVTTGTGFSTVMFEHTVPTGLADYSYYVRAYAVGAGTVMEIAQFGWRDLTANGLA